MEDNKEQEVREKSFDEKNIVERHMLANGQFNFGTAFLEADARIHDLTNRVNACEEALTFFSEWYNKTQRANILLPDNLDESGNTKLILPNG